MKQFALLLTVLILALTAAGCGASSVESESPTTDAAVESEAPLTDSNEIVLEFFSRNKDHFPEMYTDPYHQCFGGIYYDEGRCVLLLAGVLDPGQYEPVTEDMVIEVCNYPYFKLTETQRDSMQKLAELAQQGDPTAADFHSITLDDKDNRLTVSCTDLTEEKAAWFRDNISREPYLRFVSGEPPINVQG